MSISIPGVASGPLDEQGTLSCHIPSTSSLIEPKDGRRRLLDLDPSGVSQGDDSREVWESAHGEVDKRVLICLRCRGATEEEETEAIVKEEEKKKERAL